MKKVVARSKKLKVPRKSALKKQTARDTTKKNNIIFAGRHSILYNVFEILSHLGHISGISSVHLGQIKGTPWAYGIYKAYIGHILDISWAYLRHILIVSYDFLSVHVHYHLYNFQVSTNKTRFKSSFFSSLKWRFYFLDFSRPPLKS